MALPMSLIRELLAGSFNCSGFPRQQINCGLTPFQSLLKLTHWVRLGIVEYSDESIGLLTWHPRTDCLDGRLKVESGSWRTAPFTIANTVCIREQANIREDLHQHPVSVFVLSETLFHRRAIFGSGIDDLTENHSSGDKVREFDFFVTKSLRQEVIIYVIFSINITFLFLLLLITC